MHIYRAREIRKEARTKVRSLADSTSGGRSNNMDLIRFIAALAVIVSHSFAIAGFQEPKVGTITLGFIGVAIFFALSGYLITASWNNHPRVSAFMGKRVLRIVPGLAGATFFTVFVIGLLFTSLPIKEYLFSRETIEYLNNFLVYGMSATLPGVFTQNPIPSTVNGSLWTLPYEFTAYFAISILGVSLLLRKAKMLVGIFAIIILMAYLVAALNLSFSVPIIGLQIEPLFKLFGYFFAGSVLYTLRARVPYSGLLAVALICALFLLKDTYLLYVTSVLAISYLTIYIAYNKKLRAQNFGKYGDFSYGMYIYSFPIQQSIIASLPKASPAAVFIIALPISLFMAAMSWHFIEAPALSLKRVFTKHRYPIFESKQKKFSSYSVRSI